MDHGQGIHFITHEGPSQKKGKDWYWGIGLVAVACVFLAVIDHNSLFAVLAVLITIFVVIHSRNGRKELEITLGNQAIKINSEIYPYSNIKSFHINELHEPPKLHLHIDRSFMPLISIRIDRGMIEHVRTTLKRKLPEHEVEEGLLDTIIDWLDI